MQIGEAKDRMKEINLTTTTFLVWGTGHYAEVFLSQFEMYQALFLEAIQFDIEKSLQGFLDSDEKKIGGLYQGKNIYAASKVGRQEADIFVVAIRNGAELFSELQKQGIDEGQIFTINAFFSAVNRWLIDNRRMFWKRLRLEPGRDEQRAEWVRYCFQKIDHSYREKIMLNDAAKFLVLSELFEQREDILPNEWTDMIREMEIPDFVAACCWYFGDDTEGLKSLLDFIGIASAAQKGKEVKSIGFLVNRIGGGGAERVVVNLTKMLRMAGYQVTLIIGKKEREKAYALPSDIKRVYVQNRHQDYYPARVRELTQTIRECKLDFLGIHSGYSRIQTTNEIVLAKLLGVPVIVELHSASRTAINYGIKPESLAGMYRLADRLIVLSQAEYTYWEKRGVACTYIPNPIESIYELPKSDKKQASNIVLWVGRLVETPKHVLDIIPIARRVRAEIPNIKFQILGIADSAYTLSRLRKEIGENDLGSTIELCGFHPNLQRFYDKADLLLMTSESEAFPMVLLESKAMGLPTVMYELEGLELTKDGKGFVKVPQRDTEAAAMAIIRILQDHRLKECLCREARESAAPYLGENVLEKWESLFQELSR